MDRAHRLGQTRQVTVYRLITKGTIDERIVQMARVKKDVSFLHVLEICWVNESVQVQDIVVGNKNLTDVTKPNEIVQLLLNDEQLASLESSNNLPGNVQNGDKQKQNVVRDMWNDDNDDFFGHSVAPPLDRPDDNSAPGPSQATRGKGRKSATRGRKPGPKKKGSANNLDSIH